MIDVDQHGVGTIALVSGRSLVLGDDLGTARLDRPCPGARRAGVQTRKSRRDPQDRDGLPSLENGD
jgi:hypothetical protein